MTTVDKKNLFMIMCHKNLSQVSHLLKHLITSRSDVVLHIDASVPDEEYKAFVEEHKTTDNLYIADKRIKGILDDRTLVDIVFIMLDCVKSKGPDYQYYALLSGQDYAIKPIDTINASLDSSYPKPYIDCTEYDPDNWIYYKFRIKRSPRLRKTERGIKDRFGKNKLIKKPLLTGVKVLKKTVSVLGKSPYKALTGAGVELYGGSAWWILPDTAIDHIYTEYKSRTKIVRDLLVSYTPEETFFQTMAMRSPVKELIEINPKDCIAQNCMTWAYFFDDDKPFMGHPYVFTEDDYPKLKAAHQWFARKFDITIDERIIELIDENLLRKK